MGRSERFAGLAEWLVAAACVAAAVVVAGLFGREIPHVRPVVPVIAGPAPTAIVPAGLPPGATAVPLLVLPDGKQLQVGSSASVLDVLGPLAQEGPTVAERDRGETRESRTYRYAGLGFVVVTAEGRIAAIYR